MKEKWNPEGSQNSQPGLGVRMQPNLKPSQRLTDCYTEDAKNTPIILQASDIGTDL